MTRGRNENEARLRTSPHQRFKPEEDEIDLNEATRHLLEEHEPSSHGHRQITLFKRGAETIALFHFAPGGRLPDHAVNGVVVIHTLEGELNVETEKSIHTLPTGRLLRLNPNVRHDVSAPDESRMLLTVWLQDEQNDESRK